MEDLDDTLWTVVSDCLEDVPLKVLPRAWRSMPESWGPGGTLGRLPWVILKDVMRYAREVLTSVWGQGLQIPWWGGKGIRGTFLGVCLGESWEKTVNAPGEAWPGLGACLRDFSCNMHGVLASFLRDAWSWLKNVWGAVQIFGGIHGRLPGES